MKKAQMIEKLNAVVDDLTAVSEHMPEFNFIEQELVRKLKRKLRKIIDIVERADWIE